MTTRAAAVRSRRLEARAVWLWVALVVSALLWAMPLIFMLFTSLKSQAEIFSTPAFLPPSDPQWANYPDAIRRGGLLTAGLNSLIIAVIKVPVGLLVASLAAFALARLRFRWQKWLLAFFVLGTMVPIQVAVAPLFRIILNLGLVNTHLGVILPYIAFGIPFQVFVLYGFFRAIPTEMDDAARIDGASSFTLFRRVILPLALPALGALFILDFVATWNEFAMALVILQSKAAYTVPLALQNYNTQFTSSYGQLNAAIFMSMIPVLVVFGLFQRYFVSGTFSGAIKG